MKYNNQVRKNKKLIQRIIILLLCNYTPEIMNVKTFLHLKQQKVLNIFIILFEKYCVSKV